MKLYIPTCTTNLNNILSTESISPPSFYPQRKFGVKRFEKISVNNIENLIVLYSVLPSYELTDKEVDNYPMIIGVETDTLATAPQLHKEIDGVKIYTSTSTIYFNPGTTVIYISEDVFKIIQSRAEESGENKLFSLYHAAGCFKRIPREKQTFALTTYYTEKISDSLSIGYEKELENDYIIDRLKGFAYCYVIGANTSVSKEIAELRVLAKNMKNTIAAIINSPTRKPTNAQDEKLLNDIQQFNAKFLSVDKNCIQNQDKVAEAITKSDTNSYEITIGSNLKFLEFLEHHCLKEKFLEYHKVHIVPVYDAMDLYSCFACTDDIISNEYSRVLAMLSSAVAGVEKDQERDKAKPEELFNIVDYCVNIQDKTLKLEQYNDFINALIKGEQTKEEYTGGLAIAVVCGKILKKFSAQWEDSPEQKYLNGLLGNLQQSNHQFDINSIDLNELKALASFTQKCSDIDKLSDYLLNLGFNDYRFAYGLYGAAEGFATLSKTFTSCLLDTIDSYTESAYKHIYRGCLGVSLDAYPWDAKNENTVPAGMPGPSVSEGKPKSISNDLLDILERNIPEFSALDKEKRGEIIENFEQHYEGRIDLTFINKVQTQKKPGRPLGGVWDKCINYFRRSFKNSQSKQNSKNIKKEPGSLLVLSSQKSSEDKYSNHSGDESSNSNKTPLNHPKFFEDSYAKINVEKFLQSICRDSIIIENACGNLSFLQREYQDPNGRYPPKENPRTNSGSISHFKRLCFFHKNQNKIDDSPENKELFDALENYLKKIYRDNS